MRKEKRRLNPNSIVYPTLHVKMINTYQVKIKNIIFKYIIKN